MLRIVWSLVLSVVSLVTLCGSAVALDPWPVTRYRFQAHDVPSPDGDFGQTGFTDIQNNRVVGSTNDGITEAPFLLQGPGFAQYMSIQCPGTTITATTVNAINSTGQIVGSCVDATTIFGYLLQPQRGQYTFLMPAGSPHVQVLGINDSMTMAGYFYQSDRPGSHGFLLNGRRFTLVEVPVAGAQATVLFALNNQEDLVGYYLDSGGMVHGFVWLDGVASHGLWTGGTFSDLQSPDSVLTLPQDLNDQRDIVGFAQLTSGFAQSFLLHDGQWHAVMAPGAHILFSEVNGVGNRQAGQDLPPLVGRLIIQTPGYPDVVPLTQGFIAYPLPQDAPAAVAQVRGVGQQRQSLVAANPLVVEPVIQGRMRLAMDACADTADTIAPLKLRGRGHCR